ncbi:MAG: EI24 domain-containing protein [Thiotrichales bacterium]|nr:EI24 domain-containing protein [Thiotrichales bacterium]
MINLFLADLSSASNVRVFLKALLWFAVVAVVYYLLLTIGLHYVLEKFDAFQSASFGGLFVIVAPIAHIAFGFSVYVMATPLLMLILSFYSKTIFDNVYQTHYAGRSWTHSVSQQRVWHLSIKTGIIYLFIMLISLPVLLVPILGHLLYMAIGFWVFRKFLLIDMFSLWYTQEKLPAYAGLFSDEAKFILPTLLLYLLSLVPVVGLFSPYIAMILVAHLMLNAHNEEES